VPCVRLVPPTSPGSNFCQVPEVVLRVVVCGAVRVVSCVVWCCSCCVCVCVCHMYLFLPNTMTIHVHALLHNGLPPPSPPRRCGTVFPVSVVVGVAVPAAACCWGLCSRCPGVRMMICIPPGDTSLHQDSAGTTPSGTPPPAQLPPPPQTRENSPTARQPVSLEGILIICLRPP